MAIKIFIDQGHNPRNPNAGAEGQGLREQDITFEIGRRLANLLDSDPNYEVMLSRPDEETILGTTNAESLRARVTMANDWGADYFISLHANASTLSEARGCEGYVFSLGGTAEQLAQRIVTAISEATDIPDRGVFSRPTLYVLRRTRMPATLIELGFITNPREAALMSQSPQLFAQAIYNGINRFFGLA